VDTVSVEQTLAEIDRYHAYIYLVDIAESPRMVHTLAETVLKKFPAATVCCVEPTQMSSPSPSNCVCLPSQLKPRQVEELLEEFLEQGRIRARLINSLKLYQAAVENSTQALAVLDETLTCIFSNPVFAVFFGLSFSQDALGKQLPDFFGNAESNFLLESVIPELEEGVPWKGELQRKVDNDIQYCETTLLKLPEKVILLSLTDVTQQKKAFLQLSRRNEVYQSFFENSREGYYQCTPKGELLSVNPQLARMLHYESPHEMLQKVQNISELFEKKGDRLRLIANLENEIFLQNRETKMVCRDGSLIFISEDLHLVRTQGGKSVFIEVILKDLSTEKELMDLAYKDSFTGLPNRISLQKDLFELVKKTFPKKSASGDTTSEKAQHTPFCLMTADLDRFKVINDSLGPKKGDELIRQVAERMSKIMPPDCSLYRMGGDSFGVLLKSEHTTAQAERLAETIPEIFHEPFSVSGHEVFTAISIGLVHSDERYDSPEHYIRAADTAMSQVKSEGGGGWKLFVDEMYLKALNRLEMEEDIRTGLENGEFNVFFQPIVSAAEGRVIGAEALSRWTHVRKGFMSPADFIPVAEETGLILPLGEFVLRESCKQLRDWHDWGLDNLYVSVNVSMQQLHSIDLIQLVKDVLEETGIEPKFLKLELTESLAMTSMDHTIEILEGLAAMGLEISIDDFGTGYSSLAYLQHLPFHNLKIDRSFVKDLTIDKNSQVMVRIIQALAQSLSLDVIAEGVEEIEQLKMLQQEGCRNFQGFLFGQAVPAPEFLAFVNSFRKEDYFTDLSK